MNLRKLPILFPLIVLIAIACSSTNSSKDGVDDASSIDWGDSESADIDKLIAKFKKAGHTAEKV